MSGFEWGKQRTEGISVWPKIFKRTLNGIKMAIILIDTQGLFSINRQQTRGSLNQDARIYAFSAMASSVLCYNVLLNLDQRDIMILDLFSGYISFAENNPLEKSNKLFQNFIIIERDKRRDNYRFGYQANAMNELLGILPNDTIEKAEESKRIYNNYYEKIDLFYMPSPGNDVTSNAYYDGNLTEVNSSFIEIVQTLTKSLFETNNLVVKNVAGQALKAKDFVSYLKSIEKILNSKQLPNLKTYFQVSFTSGIIILMRHYLSSNSFLVSFFFSFLVFSFEFQT